MPATGLVARMAASHMLTSPAWRLYALEGLCGSGPCPRHFVLWNQKGADTGSLLFAGMARSYSKIGSYSKMGSYRSGPVSTITFSTSPENSTLCSICGVR